jgi:hypothetical protein
VFAWQSCSDSMEESAAAEAEADFGKIPSQDTVVRPIPRVLKHDCLACLKASARWSSLFIRIVDLRLRWYSAKQAQLSTGGR